MKTRWDTFKDFIPSQEIGYIFTPNGLRQPLHVEQEQKEQWSGIPKSTISVCIKNLLIAGFVKRVSHGRYRLIVHPPAELTIDDCYLIRRGDNLTYIENLHKRKERINKRKNETLPT